MNLREQCRWYVMSSARLNYRIGSMMALKGYEYRFDRSCW